MRKKIVIIVNPVSGRARALPLAEAAAEMLQTALVDVKIEKTVSAESARQFAMQYAGEVDVLVSVGGDGTLNEVVNGLLDAKMSTPTTLAILPTGTANVVARELALPQDLQGLVEVICNGAERTLDVGLAGEKRFLLCAGIGFDAAIVEAVHRNRTSRGISMASYYRPALETLFSYKFPPLRVEVDGACVSETATFTLIANLRLYGGGFSLCANARPDDGELDICCLHGKGLLRYLRYGWHALWRTMDSCPGATLFRGREIKVSSEAEVPVQVDGDSFGVLPQSFSVSPQRVSFCVPADLA